MYRDIKVTASNTPPLKHMILNIIFDHIIFVLAIKASIYNRDMTKLL